MANAVPLLCSSCGQFLIPLNFAHHCYFVCDNAKGRCYLFRGPQLLVSRDGDRPEKQVKELPSARVLRADYEVTKELYRENYRYARSLRIPSVSARYYRNKSREEIEKAAAAMTH